MAQSTVRYRFRKSLRVSADEAYAWLTDFGSEDLKMMGFEGVREVTRLTPDVYLLVDHVRRNGRQVRKEKLVHFYPEDHAWVATYIGGPLNRSQFLYEIEARGRNRSRFTFTGLQLEVGPHPPRGARLAQLTRQICAEDSASWSRIVRNLHRELARSRRGT